MAERWVDSDGLAALARATTGERRPGLTRRGLAVVLVLIWLAASTLVAPWLFDRALDAAEYERCRVAQAFPCGRDR